MNGRIVVVDDVPGAFTRFVAEHYRDRSSDGFSLAFSGGGTARDCYERLATSPDTGIDWSRVTAWWGDERCVPLDDVDSNHRLVQESLLSRVGPLAALHPMDCTKGAESYELELRVAPPLDLVHLGLGPDGHTASLFPGSEALKAPRDRLVVMNRDPLGANPHRRMTFTYAAIAAARTVVVTVAGEAKRDAFSRVVAGDASAPASAIEAPELVWLVDRAAWNPRTDR